MSIKVQHLTKVYGEQKAVNDLNFEITKGEIVGFLGPNGAGKSTTMKILTSYLTATSGRAEVCGISVSDQPHEVKKKVGYLPESNPLYYDMYVREYLEYVARIHKLPNVAAAVDEVMEKVGLTKEKHKKIGALSKGYKQRTGIAQAIIHEPEVLILDEPTSGLDPLQLDEIRALIRAIGRDKTVMLSTHIMQEVEAVCQRVMIISSGSLVKDYLLSSGAASVGDQAAGPAAQSVLHVAFKESEIQVYEKYFAGFRMDFHPQNQNELFLSGDDMAVLKKRAMQYSLETDSEILFMKEYVESLEEVFKKAIK